MNPAPMMTIRGLDGNKIGVPGTCCPHRHRIARLKIAHVRADSFDYAANLVA
jgi:hypothetical protein